MFVNTSCACVGFIGAGNKTNIPSFLPLAKVNQFQGLAWDQM